MPAPEEVQDSCLPPTARLLLLFVAGIIVAGGLLAYSNSFHGPFILDDTRSIPDNPHIRKLWPVTDAMKAPYQSTVSGRPILSLSLALNYAISGLDVWSYHAFNITVHLIAGLLLFGIVRRTLLTDRLKGRFGEASVILGGLCALLWVLHPLDTQAVTYIIQRAESMMGMFYLLTLYCAIRGFSSRRAVGWYVAAVAACALGMGTKEVMITAPIVLVLYDRVFVSRSVREIVKRRWGLYLALVAAWVLLGAILMTSPRSASAGFGIKDLTAILYAKTQFRVIVHYIRLALLPTPLVLDYGRRWAGDFSDYAPYAAAVLSLLIATILALRYRPAPGFLGAWFFLILAPTSSFVPIVDPIYEHRMYLPLAGIVCGALLGGYALIRFVLRSSRAILAVGIFLALTAAIALGAATRNRNEDYRDELTIWSDNLAKCPQSAKAHAAMGAIYLDRKNYDEAIESCTKAVQLDPAIFYAYSTRGLARVRMGDDERAIEDFGRAAALAPRPAPAYTDRGLVYVKIGRYDKALNDFNKAIQLDPTYALAYGARGAGRHQMQQYELAIADFDRAIELDSSNDWYYESRAGAYVQTSRLDLAVKDLDKALELNPTDRIAYRKRATVLKELGRCGELIDNWSQAARNIPDWPEALARLGWVLATSAESVHRNGERAVAFATRACELTNYESPQCLDVLAAAQAEAGRFDDAVRTMEKVLQLTRGLKGSIAVELRVRSELYKTGRPYRAPSLPKERKIRENERN